MSTAKTRKLILSDEVLPEDFREGADEAEWKLVAEQAGDESIPLEHVYRAGVAATSTVHYLEDRLLQVRYVPARGPEADAIIEDVVNHFAHAPDELVLEAAEEETENLQFMIDWLSSATVLGEQAGHERLADLIDSRLEHECPAIRRVALFCASWLEWPDFRARVEEMVVNDPDPEVQEDAARLASGYRLRDEGKL